MPKIDYVAEDLATEFPLAGEIYLNRGGAHQSMGRDTEAIMNVNRALQGNPRLMQAFVAIADYHVKTGNKSQPLEVVSVGLQNVPYNRGMQRW